MASIVSLLMLDPFITLRLKLLVSLSTSWERFQDNWYDRFLVLFQILEINVLNYVKFFTSQAFKLSGNPFPLICIGVKLEDNF